MEAPGPKFEQMAIAQLGSTEFISVIQFPISDRLVQISQFLLILISNEYVCHIPKSYLGVQFQL